MLDDHLQVGLVFGFTMNLKCVGSDYDCNIDALHDLVFDYADIKSSISDRDLLMNIGIVRDGLDQLKLTVRCVGDVRSRHVAQAQAG